MDAERSDSEHHTPHVDTAYERTWTDVHARQWAPTEELVNALREQIQDLREQRQVLRDDLREAHEKERLLLEMLQAERTRYDRLLEAPRQAPAHTARPFNENRVADRGDMRRRIIALLQAHPEGLSPAQIRTHLGVEKQLGDTCLGMARDGVIRRIGPGRYGVA